MSNRPCLNGPIGCSPCGLGAACSCGDARSRATACVGLQPSPVSAQKSSQKSPSEPRKDVDEKSQLASKSERSNGARAAISSRLSNILPNTVASATLIPIANSRTGSYQPVILARGDMSYLFHDQLEKAYTDK